MDKFQRVLSKGTFTLQPHGRLFGKFSSEVEKRIMWSSIQVLTKVSKKSFNTSEDIHLRESYAKLHKKPCETQGTD